MWILSASGGEFLARPNEDQAVVRFPPAFNLLQKRAFEQKRHLLRATVYPCLKAANGSFNCDLYDFRRQRLIVQLRARNMMRAFPDISNRNMQDRFNPFLLGRELQVPAKIGGRG